MPIDASACPMRAAFVLTMSPRRSSVPTERTSARIAEKRRSPHEILDTRDHAQADGETERRSFEPARNRVHRKDVKKDGEQLRAGLHLPRLACGEPTAALLCDP